MHTFHDLLKRFRSDERGAFLAVFGIMAVVLIATAGATVDFTSVQNARTRAQVALDAAALALQPEIYDDKYSTDGIKDAAQALMLNRLGTDAGTFDDDKPIKAEVVSAEPSIENGTLKLTASIRAPLYFVSLVGIDAMTMTVVSQATKGSQDLEVAVALDVTGSMDSNDKIDALIDAANAMVDILVLDQQEPTYTKMALVPWSMGVNVGSYAAAVRGAVPSAKAITGVSWMTGTSKSISAITNANPARVTTSSNHGLSSGDVVYLSGISGMSRRGSSLNNRYFTITKDTDTRFFLNSTNTSNWSNYSSSGTVRKCQVADCKLVITSNGHGFANNDIVYFTGVGGATQLNNNVFSATAVTSNTFALAGTVGPDFSTYTSGGSAWCTTHGCQYYRFQNTSNNWRIHQISTCVSERVTAPDKYTDTAPGTTGVGLNYPAPGNTCPSSQIVPLTSDKGVLHDAIDDLKAEGSTAGQVGTAWAWYMLSPNFASLWPAANRPAAYGTGNLIKVVVLMTDGSFNSVYCNGVISKDSTTGSGAAADHINCNATNGDPFTQAKTMCDAMKNGTGIVVYTVGFDIANQSSEKDMLSYCASDLGKYHLADDEDELLEAFQEIAQDIAQLRLSQ